VSRITLIALLALAACHDDRPHVFQAPPPRKAPAGAPATPVLPEIEFGSIGPAARVDRVVAQSTGAPMALSHVDATFLVMTMAARGPGAWYPDNRARLELVFTGPKTARFVRKLEHPAPVLIAHNFEVPTARDAPDGLPAGNYQMTVRLVMRDTTAIAQSAPVFLTVR
jgi:hypothetical protein